MKSVEFLSRLDLHPTLSGKFLPVSNLLKDFRKTRSAIGNGTRTPEESEFIQTKILPQVFSTISRLNSSEFDKLVEQLLTFALVDWGKEQCFKSIRILGQIFGYISSLAPKPVVNELLILFSKHDVPPQVKYYLLPEVAKHLKHPVKQVVTDTTLLHLIYFMRMKKSMLRASVSAVEAKFIHPFWLQLQYKWTDTAAGSLLPVFVQTVDILPNVSPGTLSDVKKAMTLQFTAEANVPILTLLSVAILVLGFRQFNYSAHGTEWEEITSIISSVIKSCCRPGVHDSSPTTTELRNFIIRILSTFLSSAAVESEEMLKDVIPSVPVITSSAIPDASGAKVHPQTHIPLSHGTITQHLEEMEKLVQKIKGYDAAGLSPAEKARVLRAASELERVCQ